VFAAFHRGEARAGGTFRPPEHESVAEEIAERRRAPAKETDIAFQVIREGIDVEARRAAVGPEPPEHGRQPRRDRCCKLDDLCHGSLLDRAYGVAGYVAHISDGFQAKLNSLA